MITRRFLHHRLIAIVACLGVTLSGCSHSEVEPEGDGAIEETENPNQNLVAGYRVHARFADGAQVFYNVSGSTAYGYHSTPGSLPTAFSQQHDGSSWRYVSSNPLRYQALSPGGVPADLYLTKVGQTATTCTYAVAGALGASGAVVEVTGCTVMAGLPTAAVPIVYPIIIGGSIAGCLAYIAYCNRGCQNAKQACLDAGKCYKGSCKGTMGNISLWPPGVGVCECNDNSECYDCDES